MWALGCGCESFGGVASLTLKHIAHSSYVSFSFVVRGGCGGALLDVCRLLHVFCFCLGSASSFLTRILRWHEMLISRDPAQPRNFLIKFRADFEKRSDLTQSASGARERIYSVMLCRFWCVLVTGSTD